MAKALKDRAQGVLTTLCILGVLLAVYDTVWLKKDDPYVGLHNDFKWRYRCDAQARQSLSQNTNSLTSECFEIKFQDEPQAVSGYGVRAFLFTGAIFVKKEESIYFIRIDNSRVLAQTLSISPRGFVLDKECGVGFDGAGRMAQCSFSVDPSGGAL